ncbi:MAG: DUF418 domain-containing protein [Gemmatimonadetes bacterium]|nr:DUF418 domain-containing protein [Gemmatimonadota bacterium]MYA65422.1 DUF418 domain-containing protein [Gemmatimonadota bacterium]MYB97156.1 DUF418 domain-containing protein [Gemmatimonadota bacterium]MYH52807.1 DUF418 domain-containing protein [Gemmatimonadota bacterium]MYI47152.1 DUF418 domain-containing protein [Gemmatimonadota bacterium]
MLRGFAVLGILIVNIQGFARVASAFLNPTSGRVLAGADLWTWGAIYLFADTKFISIFSLLFGAGIALMSERMEQRGVSGASIHCRRNAWLLAFGLVHAYLIWHGDILVTYAVCGFLLYPLRNLEPRKLLWIGGCSMAFVIPLWSLLGFSMPYWPEAERAALMADWAPTADALDAEIAAFRGDWTGQLRARAPIALSLQTSAFLGLLLWRAGGMMLVGMAMYRLGVLAAARPTAFYRRLVVVGLAAGLPLAAAGTAYKIHVDFALDRAMFQGSLFNYVGSVGVFLAYLGLVMLMVKGGRLPRLQRRLAATGRMALTNYITQSLICSLVFHGHGLELFERVGGPGQVAIVAGIWMLQLAWSPWWLARFRFGPLEWLWRSLTYMKRQPMRV